jgi:1,4-dihydroxy-6-naphthoate synthase
MMQRISRIIRQSIQYSLDHRQPALQHALQYAGDMDAEKADQFVGMYVNNWTLDYGDRGREAVRRLIEAGIKAGIILNKINVEFLED